MTPSFLVFGWFVSGVIAAELYLRSYPDNPLYEALLLVLVGPIGLVSVLLFRDPPKSTNP